MKTQSSCEVVDQRTCEDLGQSNLIYKFDCLAGVDPTIPMYSRTVIPFMTRVSSFYLFPPVSGHLWSAYERPEPFFFS